MSKQADVLMLFQLLTADELYAVLDRLGYRHDPETIPRTIAFYLERTSHGSTLSKVVHSWVLARADRSRAWGYFLEALDSDICDTQGGTTGEGIHLGAMAGTIDLLQRGFTGLETRKDALWLDPYLPDGLASMRFRLRYRHHPEVEVTIDHERLTVGGSRQARRDAAGAGPRRAVPARSARQPGGTAAPPPLSSSPCPLGGPVGSCLADDGPRDLAGISSGGFLGTTRNCQWSYVCSVHVGDVGGPPPGWRRCWSTG